MGTVTKKYLDTFYWKDYANILLGLALYAFGLIGFIKPGGVVTGGLTGVALLVEYGTSGKIPLQSTYFIVNCCLLLFSLKILGVKFLLKTIFSVIVLTLFLTLAQMFLHEPIVKNEPLMSGIIGAMLCGAGIGLVFNANGSTGGTDIVVAVMNKYRNMAFGRGMLLCDFIIISCSFFVFHDYIKIIQGLIVMGVMTYTIDMVINGFRQSVQFLIISRKYSEISDMVNHDLKRGCTVLDGMGWYSKQETKVILLLVRRNQASEIMRAIKTIDPNAFISQSVVKGVFGEGFDKI
ncbi:MAG: YitT family protein [Dysgonamonadaceae bacterium]